MSRKILICAVGVGLLAVACSEVYACSPPPPPPVDPIARINGSAAPVTIYACKDSTVVFDGNASSDPDGGSITNYKWEFPAGADEVAAHECSCDGCGTKCLQGPTCKKVECIFTSTGDHVVKLTVTDNDNPAGTDTCQVTVKVVEVTNVTSDKTTVHLGCDDDITFTVTTNPPGDCEPVTWSGGGPWSSTSPDNCQFTTHWDDPGAYTVTATCGSSSANKQVKVIGVDVVEWIKFGSNPDITGNKIFPGLVSHDDAGPWGGRRTVYVQATVIPASEASGKWVYFKVLDPDDPSSDPDIDTNGDSGGDNFDDGTGIDEGGELGTTAMLTNGSGEARNELRVSRQPGNNFVVAASTCQARINELTQATYDSGDIPRGVELSPILTTWRKLHLELDSMAAGQDHPVTNRNIDDTWNNTPHAGESGAEIHNWDPDLDEGQYEGGTLTVSSVNFEIIDNIDDWFDDTVYVLGNICPYEDNLASFGDDDVCPLPRKVNWSVANSKLAEAYVEVVEETGVYDPDATFQANLGPLDPDQASAGNPVRQRTTSDDYWMLQILSCHQGERPTDGDADTIYHFHSPANYKEGDLGWRYGQTSSVDGTNDNISAVFLETIRDAAAQEPFLVSLGIIDTAYSATAIEKTTVVHEIGFAFGCDYSDGGIMTAGVDDPNLGFTGASIHKIRSLEHIGVP